MWGRLLLHFIRKLIRRLFNLILCRCPLSLLSSSTWGGEEMRRGRGRRTWFSSVYFTSLYLRWLQFRAVQFSSPACRIRMSVICFYFLCLYNRPPDCLSVTPVWSPPPPSCRFSPAAGGGAVWVVEERLAPAAVKENIINVSLRRKAKWGKLLSRQ